MSDLADLMLSRPRKSRGSRFRPAALLLVPLAAILFQVYVPLFFRYLAYLELPLLVTVYYAMMRRGPVAALLYGALIGLIQDSLSHQPLGMFGIVKTLVGYFTASVCLRFDADNPAGRLILAFSFFLFHQFFYWVLGRALLGNPVEFGVQQTILLGLMNALVAVPLFHLLDKLRERN